METEGQEAGGGGQTCILSLDTKSVKPYASQDEYLYAMKEDLAEWFNTLYGHNITVDNFFEQLETGVIMCQHANNVQSFIKEQVEQLKKNKGATPKRPAVSLPDRPVQYRSNVKPGSFQSRDNVSNFISWCKALGINNVILFETEDLVLRKNEKHVVLCLLEVARRGAQYGMLAPTLVQMEREIDAEIAGQEPEPVPHVQRKTCDLMSLDEMVREMVSRCTCPDQFPMVKVSDGKYRIGDSQTLIFVRILRNHVMVRIGGGWDTLQNYLDRHDPCQCASKGHKGRVGGTTPAKVTTRRQSAPATQLVGLEQRMRTNTPSADNAKNQKTSEPRATTPSKQTPATKSKRSHSLAPIVCGEPQWKSPQKTTAVNRSLDPSALPGMRSPSPASSEASQASTRRSGVVSMSRDSGISSRREADSASDASSSCGGSPGLHKRFNSANDVSFPKELTLAAVDEDNLPRQRPTSARERVRRATATSSIPTTKKSSNITNNNTKETPSSRGRQKQRNDNMYVAPDRHARSRSVEPMELTNDRYARKANNVKKSGTPQKKKKQDADEVLIISRDSAGRHRLGPQPVPQSNGDSSDLDGYPSGSSRHSSTSSSMSGLSCGPTNGYSNGHSSSGEEKRPGTPRVNISPDRILPDKPKLMSRSHTADLGHLGEKTVAPGGDTDTDTDTECKTQTANRMSVSSNQSSTLSLASSFDDYPEPPPEDRNLNAEMERLFEEYRRQEMRNKKKSTPSRHRRSNSADLLEMSDSSFDRQRINNAFQKARSSSRDMLDSSSSRVRSRRSSNVSVESNNSTTNTRQSVSSSSTPRRVGTITPTPTRTSSLRGTLGMARELRNKLNEQAMSGTRASPIRSSSMNTHRPTTPLTSSGGNQRGNVNNSQSGAYRGRSQTRDPLKSKDEYRAGSRASSRASSRPSSRASSRNVSRDSSLTRVRPSSAMSHREQQERMTPRRPASARPTPAPSANGRPRSNSTTNLYPEANDTCTILSPEGPLTCQTNLLDRDPEFHTPKPRKDKREGRTRIPMPVDMLANAKYDTGDQPLRRYDSGVDINNMSPTESSVHGDDNWQQELLLQPDQGTLQFATPSLGYNLPSGGRTNGQASFDDLY